MRIGFGFDSHAFAPGVPLRIGGVAIEHPEGLAGHSDGDVLLHALTDALLGAVAAGDIGTFFPPTDPQWKNANSALFLEAALEEVEKAGFTIKNVDTTLILAAPKISPIAKQLRESLAHLLDMPVGCVSVKAKTPEGLNQDGVAVAHAVVLLDINQDQKKLELAAVAMEAEQMIDDAAARAVSDAGLEDRLIDGDLDPDELEKVGPPVPARWSTEDMS